MAWVRTRHSTERERLLISWALHVRLAVNWNDSGTRVGLPTGSVFTCRNKEIYENSGLLQAYSAKFRLGFPPEYNEYIQTIFSVLKCKINRPTNILLPSYVKCRHERSFSQSAKSCNVYWGIWGLLYRTFKLLQTHNSTHNADAEPTRNYSAHKLHTVATGWIILPAQTDERRVSH